MKLVHWVLLLGIAWLIQAGSQSHLVTENNRLQRENEVLKRLLAERSAGPGEDQPFSPVTSLAQEAPAKSRSDAWFKWWSISSGKRYDPRGKEFMTSRGRPFG
jgi:hypothetical protein